VSPISALIESILTRKLKRDSMNLYMQGVHIFPQGVHDKVCNTPGFEPPF
jgi:hypothetical protein